MGGARVESSRDTNANTNAHTNINTSTNKNTNTSTNTTQILMWVCIGPTIGDAFLNFANMGQEGIVFWTICEKYGNHKTLPGMCWCEVIQPQGTHFQVLPTWFGDGTAWGPLPKNNPKEKPYRFFVYHGLYATQKQLLHPENQIHDTQPLMSAGLAQSCPACEQINHSQISLTIVCFP